MANKFKNPVVKEVAKEETSATPLQQSEAETPQVEDVTPEAETEAEQDPVIQHDKPFSYDMYKGA